MKTTILSAVLIVNAASVTTSLAADADDHLIPEQGVFDAYHPEFDLHRRHLLVDPIEKGRPSFYVAVLPSFTPEWVLAGYEQSSTLKLVRSTANLWYRRGDGDPQIITESKAAPLAL